MGKPVYIELFNSELGVQKFEITHAERILNYTNSGWELKEESKYTYTKENGIRIKSDKGSIKE